MVRDLDGAWKGTPRGVSSSPASGRCVRRGQVQARLPAGPCLPVGDRGPVGRRLQRWSRTPRGAGESVRIGPAEGARVRQVRAQPDGPCAPSAARLHPTSRGEDAEGGLCLTHPLRAKRKAGSAFSC